ncbi:MAG: secretin N-terminal domain-containing protein [Chthoniobacteraceae bacterium]
MADTTLSTSPSTCFFTILTLGALWAANGLRAQAPAPPTPGGGTVQLQFPNNGVADVLGIYELLTGKAIVKESTIFDGNPISLVTAAPVTEKEAIELIESSLQLNGYVLTQSPDGRSVRVAMSTSPQANLTRGLKVYTQEDQLPVGHSMASYLLRLENLDPAEAAVTLWSHVGLNTFGRITPVTSPPGLLITENADNIRQILRVAEVLDVAQGQSLLETEFYPLKYADAVVIGQIITTTFKTKPVSPPITTDTVGDRANRVPPPEVTSVPPRVVADDRLNRLMVVARAADQAYVRRLIEEFDQPIKALTPLERRLKYVFVDQVISVLVDILQDTGSGSSTMAGGEVVRTRRAALASPDPATLTGRPRPVTNQVQSTKAPAGYEDTLLPPEETAPPISVLVGKTRLVADVQANKLIAYGPAEDLAKISSLLDRLDHKPPQVYLATIIGQLTLDDNFEVGVDYLRQFNAGGHGNFAAGLLTSDAIRNAVADIRNPLTSPVQPLGGLTFYGQLADGLDVFVRALESTQRFKVLSRPSIYAANNKKATITSGQRIPVPTSTVSDLSNNSRVQTNIAFQDVVLKLEVIPLINSNKEINLTVAQVNDNVIGEQKVADNVVPIISTERLVTTVTVENRHTVVLGGLITESQEKTNSGVPVLSRIPLLGMAFRSTKTRKQRKELLIFIQPVVVEDNQQADATSEGEERRTDIAADAQKAFPNLPRPEFRQRQLGPRQTDGGKTIQPVRP